MFFGLPDPGPDHEAKIVRKTLIDSYCFVTSFGFFIFENYVNVPLKSNKQKIFVKKKVFVGALKVNDENSRIQIRIRTLFRIHTKMSWIRNTGFAYDCTFCRYIYISLQR
jgi:hypothetical protein